MRPIKHIIRVSFFILLVYGCVSQALSIEKNSVKTSTGKSSNELQSYIWYDGQKKRTVWLNPNLTADFKNDSAQENLFRKNHPGASIIRTHRSVQIWRQPIQAHSSSTALGNKNSSGSIPHGYSPVFHDSPTQASRIRALPGNVIVYLDPTWDKEMVTQWIDAHSLIIIKTIEIRANAYILKSDSGMQALQLANTLFESGDVVAAFPDWWLESTTR